MASMQPADYEKLGQFYLGREYDLEKKTSADKNLVLYDSKDLVTHAIVVGMTGSGKTGLCIDVIEEAAIDGVPAIAIDPKGDLTNLLLTFPDLRPEDFRPWVNEDDAARKGVSADEYAKQQADLWRTGLASWGEDGERIRRLKGAADAPIIMGVVDQLQAQLDEATAQLRTHLASWPHAFAMAGSWHGGGEHPALRAVREENDLLRARCRDLRARIAELT